eukprot:4249320-Prymnesium_polylepis.1
MARGLCSNTHHSRAEGGAAATSRGLCSSSKHSRAEFRFLQQTPGTSVPRATAKRAATTGGPCLLRLKTAVSWSDARLSCPLASPFSHVTTPPALTQPPPGPPRRPIPTTGAPAGPSACRRRSASGPRPSRSGRRRGRQGRPPPRGP